MSNDNKTHLDIFIEEAEKARNIPLSEADILEINEIARQAEIEEQEEEAHKRPPVAAKATDHIAVGI